MAENINIKEIGKMYELGLVNDDTECKFVHLYKGRYTYELTVGGKLYQFSNGFQSYDSAYYLELDRVKRLADLVDCQTFEDDADK
jgi:hypothetical protein